MTWFEGRANRREYWMYQLFLFLVATAVMLLAGVLGVQDGDTVALPTVPAR